MIFNLSDQLIIIIILINIHLMFFLILIQVMHNLFETIKFMNLSHLFILLNFFHYFS